MKFDKFDKFDVLAITLFLVGFIGVIVLITINTKDKQICHLKGGTFINYQCLKIQTIEI